MKNLLLILLLAITVYITGNSSIITTITAENDTKTALQLTKPKCYEEIFDTCFFTTSQDCDGDGYPNWRWLVVDMKGEAPSGEAFYEVWLNSGEDYYLLATSDLFKFPVTRHSMKIFGVEHLVGNIVIILKDEGIDEDVDYYHIKDPVTIESPENDFNAEIGFCDWAGFDFIDADGDGYFSQHRLQLNVNTCPYSAKVYFKVSACKQPVLTDPCWYYTSPVYYTDVFGEILHMIFGGVNGSLSHGDYKIDLQVFNAITDEPLTDVYHFDNDMKFELPEEDEAPPVDFSIDNVYLGDEKVDMDFDDYSRSRDLNFDVNVSSGTYELTAKIFYKKHSEADFEPYNSYTTDPFTIIGSAEEYQKVIIGIDFNELPHNIYDFKIQLFVGTTMVAEKLPNEDHDLNAQWFETTMEDEPFKMNSAYWSIENDWDGDSHASYRELTVEFDVYVDPEPVYIIVKSYYGEGEVTVLKTEGFIPSASGDTYTFDVPGERYLYGNGAVFLYRASDDELINVIYGIDTRFEAPEDDMVYSISSMEWTDGIDFDLDGYYSYRKLDVDVLAAPLERTLLLEVSMCKQPPTPDPCPYITGYYFKADSTDDDIISIELGLPNPELDSAIYQLTFKLIDSLTNEMVGGYITVDDNLKMEPSDNDQYKFFMNNAYLSSESVDMDGDSYYASRRLLFDIDVTGGNHSVYAVLYYQPEGETEFNEYYTTTEFNVTPGVVSYEMIAIGAPNTQLEHGTYDFKLVVYNAENDETLMIIMPEDDRDFNDQLYETVPQDAPPVNLRPVNFEPVTKRNILVFPNPFDNVLTISYYPSDDSDNALIRIIDSKGILIREERIKHLVSNNPSNIRIDNLEELRPGIYILEIQSPGAIGQLLILKR